MSKAGRRRKTRATIFYICATVAVILAWMYRGAIWLGVVVFLNSLTEIIDSLMGG